MPFSRKAYKKRNEHDFHLKFLTRRKRELSYSVNSIIVGFFFHFFEKMKTVINFSLQRLQLKDLPHKILLIYHQAGDHLLHPLRSLSL